MLRAFLRTLVILPLGLLAVCAGLTPAVAQPSSVNAALGEQAILVARGAAVDVPVIYTCSPEDFAFGFIELSVSEGVPAGGVAQGSGASNDVICDGSQHTTFVLATSNNGIAFRKGTALALGSLAACNANGLCNRASLSDLIRVVRK